MLGLADLIGYILIIILAFIAVYFEGKHYACDDLTCDAVDWAKRKSSNDKEKYMKYVEIQTRHTVWMRVFIITAIITAFTYWWFINSLPPVIFFLAFQAVLFFVIYFGFAYYQHHFLEPVNEDLLHYMDRACSQGI